MIEKADMKIKLGEEKVATTKVTAHAAMLATMNELTKIAIDKMTHDAAILMANTTNMNDTAKK